MQRWLLLLTTVLLGVAIGLGSFTFVYAEGHSYLRDDPEVCANCHVMNEQMDAWRKSSHKAVATCNDCHTSHENLAKCGQCHVEYYFRGPEKRLTYPRDRAARRRALRDERAAPPTAADRDAGATALRPLRRAAAYRGARYTGAR